MRNFESPAAPLNQYPEYRVWSGMRVRCHPITGHARYGLRGIRVCDEWDRAGGFIAFYEHIGPRPSDKHEIDRINNDGNYEPGNVRWVTKKENLNNTSRNIDWQGKFSVSWERICEMVEIGPPLANRNVARGKKNATEYSGVTYEWRTPEYPYRARCRLNGRYCNLGRYTTPEGAALVRDLAVYRCGRPTTDLNFEIEALQERFPDEFASRDSDELDRYAQIHYGSPEERNVTIRLWRDGYSNLLKKEPKLTARKAAIRLTKNPNYNLVTGKPAFWRTIRDHIRDLQPVG